MKRVAIIQSSYIPWKGYFDIINSVDEFILYDDVQYTKRDWRNRNRIKTDQGTKWLSIPVIVKGRRFQKIVECRVADNKWSEAHWHRIVQYYRRAPYFASHAGFFLNLYDKCKKIQSLSQINHLFTTEICKLVGITTPITWSMDYDNSGDRSERLLHLCLQSSADEYVSGPSARGYLDENLFAERGIRVSWMDYDGYPEYNQLFSPPFIHEVSIIDLILNVGAENVTHFCFRTPKTG